MATLQPVPSTLQIVVQQQMGTDADVVNKIYMEYSGSAPTGAQLVTFATSVGNAWGTHVSPMQTSDVTQTFCEVTDLSSPTSAQGSHSGSNTGSRPGNYLPGNVAALINYSIARRYRGGKPRTYVVAGSDTDLATAQTWTSGFVGALTTAWSGFLSALQAAGWPGAGTLGQVNVHRYSGFTNEAYGSPVKYRRVPTPLIPPVVDPILAFSVNTKMGTQRRRIRSG